MRIIDSNTDYYDFYQNIYRDNTFTFDRRDSYNLTHKGFANNFNTYRSESKERFILLQIAHQFWLMRLTITELDGCWCSDYQLELVANWQNYCKPIELIKLSCVDFPWSIIKADNMDDYIMAVDHNNYRTMKIYNDFTITKNADNWRKRTCEKRTIPILKDIGIPAIIPALDIYLALEEYFSELKTNSERTEAIGTTNEDKISSHGFDVKKSFRGK